MKTEEALRHLNRRLATDTPEEIVVGLMKLVQKKADFNEPIYRELFAGMVGGLYLRIIKLGWHEGGEW